VVGNGGLNLCTQESIPRSIIAWSTVRAPKERLFGWLRIGKAKGRKDERARGCGDERARGRSEG
jgi:hypothetical protein